MQLIESQLTVTWNDGHESVYPLDFLRKRNFTKEGKIRRQSLFKFPNTIPWGRGIQGKIPTFQFEKV